MSSRRSQQWLLAVPRELSLTSRITRKVRSRTAMTSKNFTKPGAGECASECEFCLELSKVELSRFGRTYRCAADSRLIAEQNGVVVMPTLGQLFTASLLILPQMHFETVAELPTCQRRACLRFAVE